MVGHTVSHYRMLEELKSGGRGVAYRAEGRQFITEPMRRPTHVYPLEAAFADRNSLCFVTFHFTRQGRQPFLFGP